MSVLSLGTVTFNVDDLPEEINLGGNQTLAVRQFPGGGMDIQPLGAFDDVIQWDATFLYRTALSNCKTLDTMRQQGQIVLLKAGPFERQVIVQAFTYMYRNEYNMPYHIELQPLTSYMSNVTVNGLPNPTPVAISTSSNTSGASAPGTAQQAAKAPPKPQRTYTVKRGDTLWGIAVKCYGNGTKWTTIASRNGIKNPRLLSIGTRLVIP